MTKEITIYCNKKEMVKVLRETIKLNCDLSSYDESVNFKAMCNTSKKGNITSIDVYKIGSKSLLYKIDFMNCTATHYQRTKAISKNTYIEIFEDYDYYKINNIEKVER